MPIDTVMPSGKWTFDREVTNCFDDMLSRSIPDYQTMRELTTALAIKHLYPGSVVIDIGCSRGSGLAPILEAVKDVKAIGYELSAPMADAAKERFKDNPDVKIHCLDARSLTPYEGTNKPSILPPSYDVVLSVLTIQFIPIECRLGLLRNLRHGLRQGGCLLYVEKVLADDLFVDSYYDFKRQTYTQEQIDAKRKSLENVLVPLTKSWNVQMLHEAGFSSAHQFWQALNFAGWIAK